MTAPGAPAALSVTGIRKRFGGIVAADDVSFDVAEQSVVGLIGPNGSGKTTLLNLINGVLPADEGSCRLGGALVTGKRPVDLTLLGLSRTFQAARVFRTLTVIQNMFIPLLHQPALERRESERVIEELLYFVGLGHLSSHTASELSGGQQRLLEFARALVTKPRIVLMDEPFAGVHPEIKAVLIRCIRETVTNKRTSLLIVSHEVPDLVAMSDFMVCLVEGRVVSSGNPTDVVKDEKVIEGYLGRG